MKKKILSIFTALFMLISFATPTFAQEKVSDNNFITFDSRAIPQDRRAYTKTKTISGMTVKIKIECTEIYTTAGSIMNYVSGDCSVVSVDGGTVTLTSDFKSGSAGVGVDDDLIVIVYFNYKTDSGYTGSSSISFTIRGNSLV